MIDYKGGKNCADKSQGNGENYFRGRLDFQITEGFPSPICTSGEIWTCNDSISFRGFDEGSGKFNSETSRHKIGNRGGASYVSCIPGMFL